MLIARTGNHFGEGRNCRRSRENQPRQALAAGPAVSPSPPRWLPCCCCRSRRAMLAGFRIFSRARRRTSRPSTAPRQSGPPPAKSAASPKPRAAKLATPGTGRAERHCFETGRNQVRSAKISYRRRCRTYRRIGRRDQRPQHGRVRLQPASCEGDRAEAEGRRLCRDEAARHRGQGQAQPRQARRHGQQLAGQPVPVDPP